MTDGWIKLHRKLLDNPVVNKDPDHLAVWIWLLLNATHRERAAMFNGQKVTLKPGELITGRKKIAEETGVSPSKVFRILEQFKSEQQIEQQTNRHGSLISIVRWNDYQQSEQQNEQLMSNHRTTSEQPVNTNKNDKNDKNVKNDKNIIINAHARAREGRFDDDIVSDEARKRLQALREKIKKGGK